MILRESQARRLAIIYLVAGSALFFSAMYYVSTATVRVWEGLNPDGSAVEPARPLKNPVVPKPKPTRHVPPATPTVPFY